MTWQRFAVGWLLVSIAVSVVIGPLLKRRRLELEAQQEWAHLLTDYQKEQQ